MTNALFYYRTNATRAALVPDPFNLPAAQKLEYDAPTNFFEGVEKIGENNLIITPSPNSSGVKKTTLEDNGLKGIGYRFHGNFDKGTGDASVEKIENFFGQLNVEEAYHVEGIFGIKAANTDVFDVDPDNVHGLGFKKYMFKHVGPMNSIYDFSVDLVHGGLFTPPSV